jgi:tetratricopeptide (TPR) repeat protein
VPEAAPGANLDATGGEVSPTATREAPAAPTPEAALAPAAAAVPAAAASSAAAGAAALERRRNEIIQAYLSYRRLDAFDLLGVDEDASPGAVELRYLDFARRFAPWALGGPELADMEEQARDLFLAGARAYSELLDLELRNALLFRRKSRREERDRRPAADLHAIKTDLLDPEVQYRKGRALADAGKFQEAAVLFEFAAVCDPQNGLYSAELAYSRFCIAPGQGVKALKELHETLRRDPDCGLAVYYTGEIHRQMGDREDAEKMLRRAIKMMAPDRRPIEALKQLSAERRR